MRMPTEKRPGHMPPHLPGGDLMTKVVRTAAPRPIAGSPVPYLPLSLTRDRIPFGDSQETATRSHLIMCICNLLWGRRQTSLGHFRPYRGGTESLGMAWADTAPSQWTRRSDPPQPLGVWGEVDPS